MRGPCDPSLQFSNSDGRNRRSKAFIIAHASTPLAGEHAHTVSVRLIQRSPSETHVSASAWAMSATSKVWAPDTSHMRSETQLRVPRGRPRERRSGQERAMLRDAVNGTGSRPPPNSAPTVEACLRWRLPTP